MKERAWLKLREDKLEPVIIVAFMERRNNCPIAVIIRENGDYDWVGIDRLREQK